MKPTPRFVIAAVLLLLTCSIAWFIFRHSTTHQLADAADTMKDITAARCKVTTETAVPGQPKRTSELRALMTDSGWVICENQAEASKTIISQSKHTELKLLTQQKVAILNETTARTIVPDLFARLKKMEPPGDKSLGQKEIAGATAQGFQVVSPDSSEMHLWIDIKTRRPLLISMTIIDPIPCAFTFTNFEWNPAFDPKELTLDIPQGYQLQPSKNAPARPTEADVVALLKLQAECNGGTFADGIAVEDTLPLMKKYAAAVGPTLANETARQEFLNALKLRLVAITHGWSYISSAATGSDWHYAGKGVTVGEKNKPILWYKTPNNTWRAFHADLTIHDAKKSELLPGTPVLLTTTTLPANTTTP